MIPKEVAGRDINWHTPFGPVIMETQISDDLHNILLTRADQIRNGTHPNPNINTETNDYRTRLAGCLSEEYSYKGAFTKEEDVFIEAEQRAGARISRMPTGKTHMTLQRSQPNSLYLHFYVLEMLFLRRMTLFTEASE